MLTYKKVQKVSRLRKRTQLLQKIISPQVFNSLHRKLKILLPMIAANGETEPNHVGKITSLKRTVIG